MKIRIFNLGSFLCVLFLTGDSDRREHLGVAAPLKVGAVFLADNLDRTSKCHQSEGSGAGVWNNKDSSSCLSLMNKSVFLGDITVCSFGNVTSLMIYSAICNCWQEMTSARMLVTFSGV
jgi:hypothetical protein